jgi:hypothetical protein
MSTIVQMTTVPADLIGAQAMHRPKPADKARKPAPAPESDKDAEADPEERWLAIREGAAQGIPIYSIQDRASGRVVVQLARADVEEIAQRPDYSAGQVIDTKI